MSRAPQPRQSAILRMLGNVEKLPAATIETRLRSLGFAVTRRTLERDLLALVEQGELLADEAKPRGYRRAGRGALVARRKLEPTELMLLRLARQHLHHMLPGGLERAFDELLAGEDAATRHDTGAGRSAPIERWPSKVRIIPATLPRQRPRVPSRIYAAVCEALLHERAIELEYWTRYRDAITTRQVHPLGLVQRGYATYLVASGDQQPPVRWYALQRIRRATVLESPSSAPPGFSLDAWIGENDLTLVSPTIDLELLVGAEAVELLAEAPLAVGQTLEPRADGAALLRARLPWDGNLERWLLSMGPRVTVLAPAKLRARMAGELHTALAPYAASFRE